MKIGNIASGKGVDRSKRKAGAAKSGSSAFADQLRGASASADTNAPEGVVTEPVAALGGVDALLAMQEVGDGTDEQTRRQAESYGRDLLDRLTGLQDALLRGAIAKDSLVDLAARIRTARTKVQDPRLNSILDEIELRAEVEISKYTRKG